MINVARIIGCSTYYRKEVHYVQQLIGYNKNHVRSMYMETYREKLLV